MIIAFYSQVSLSSSLVFTKVPVASASVSLWLFTVSYRRAVFLLNFICLYSLIPFFNLETSQTHREAAQQRRDHIRDLRLG